MQAIMKNTVFIAFVVVGSFAFASTGEGLLAGVRSARLPLTQGRIKMTKKVENFMISTTETTSLTITWKNDSFRAEEVVLNTSGNVPAPDSEHRVSFRSGNDKCYRIPGGAVLDAPSKGHFRQLFDPRFLGVVPSPSASSLVSNALFPEGESESIAVVGEEVIHGITCSKITQTTKSHSVREIWVANTKNFPVLRCRDLNNNSVAEAKYGDLPIPKEVSSTLLNRETNQPDLKFHFVVESVDFSEISDNEFTINNLDLKVGDSVQDDREGQILGYWDGKGLQPRSDLAFERASARPIPVNSSGRRLLIFSLVGIVFLSAIAIIGFFSNRKGSK